MNKQRSSFLRFLSFVRPYWHFVAIASIAGVLRFLVPLFVPWGIKIIVDDILTKPESPEQLGQLGWILAALFAAYLVWIIASYWRLYLTGLAGNRVIFDLRHRLFGHIQKMSLDFFEKKKIGTIVSRMIHDIGIAQQMISHGVTAVLMDLSSILVIAIIMTTIHWKLALVSFAVIPLYVFISKYFMHRIKQSSKGVQEHVENLSGNLYEKLSAVSVVQSFAREPEEEAVFLDHCRGHLNAVMENVRLQALGLSMIGFLAGIAPLMVIGYGALSVISGTLSVGELVAFYAYVGFLYMPVTRLTELNVVIGSSLAAIDRIFEVFDIYPTVQEKPKAINVQSVKGKVAFRDVTFGYYASEAPVLKRLNLEIAPGEATALMGLSGSGKSTLAKLLLRFYDVQGGAIVIDDLDIRDFTLSSLRRHIALVGQEPILFSGTVMENILYGRPGATAAEAVRAAQDANAHAFILKLPRQYEARIGERGVTLSAGEKQRIAIARAFLKNAPILILDEPTSALDEVSESLLTESLQELRRDRTTLLISHRLSTLEGADRVIRLDNRGAVETRPKLSV